MSLTALAGRSPRISSLQQVIQKFLHTPGGLVLAASQIARALANHHGRTVAVVPH